MPLALADQGLPGALRPEEKDKEGEKKEEQRVIMAVSRGSRIWRQVVGSDFLTQQTQNNRFTIEKIRLSAGIHVKLCLRPIPSWFMPNAPPFLRVHRTCQFPAFFRVLASKPYAACTAAVLVTLCSTVGLQKAALVAGEKDAWLRVALLTCLAALVQNAQLQAVVICLTLDLSSCIDTKVVAAFDCSFRSPQLLP
ncbi:hypothetical protein BC830DRAFT_1080837 [Chytriomyces sp. MP71]|nr:hypothetical protein BC830DRAFT_1080837 [Chytriomyces sp. MP71]